MSIRLLALFCLVTGVAFAQGERATLNGTVTDPAGATVPSAMVHAVNVETKVDFTATTTDAGVYRLPYLPPGTYRMNVVMPGFKNSIRENIVVGVAQTLTVDFRVEVGQQSDQVTVSSEAPLIETGTAEIGSYVTKKEFDTWPITVGDGRRQIQQFIFTSLPGTTGGTFQGTINGGQAYSHEILIDGIALGRMDLQGGSNNEFSPSAEAVSEFKLQTGLIGAQYSGGQTAVANFAIKSGTNKLHGSGYYYWQNDALRANGWGNNAAGIKRQPFKQNNYGGSLGGPVYLPKIYRGTNKTFFFANVERTVVHDYRSTSFSTLPVLDFKRGDFSRLLNPAFTAVAASGTAVGTDALGRPVQYGTLFDPSTTRSVGGQAVRDPFPGNIIPKGRWDAVSSKILELAPITDPLFDTMLNNIPALGACCPNFHETMVTIRGDHNISSNHRLTSTLSRNLRERNNSPGGRWGVPPGTPTSVYQLQKTPGTLGRFTYDWIVRPALLNHFAIGYNRFGNNNESVFVDQDWPQKIGLQNVPGTHFPTLTFTGRPEQGGGIGAGGRLGSGNAGGSFNGSTIIQDDMTYIRGKHSFKYGFEQRRYYYNSRNKSGSGAFTFSPNQTALPGFNTQTGNAFASFLLGAYSATNRGIAAANFGHRWRETGFYFADDYKLTQKLTLNLGLRWEVIGGLFEVAGRMSGLGFSTPNPGAGGRLGALVFADDMNRKGFMDRNYKQLSPKFGFAYAVSQKLVVRGGYGINNTPPISNGFGFGGTLGYNGSISKNASNTQLQYAEDPIGFLRDPYPSFTATLPNKNPSLSNGMGITYTAPDSSRLPYVQNWSFGFQYQMPAATVVEVNYIGNKGTRLISYGFDNLNQAPIGALATYGNALGDPWSPASGVPLPYAGFVGTVAQALRPYPQFINIGQQVPNLGTSLYNSLQVQATRHLSKGFSILAAYTFSKAIQMAGDTAIDGHSSQDVYNRRIERTISPFNYPNFFKFTWIYDLPIGPNRLIDVKGVAGRVVGGWTLTGIHNVRSGNPLSIGVAAASNPISGNIRPDLVLGQTIVNNSSPAIAFRGRAGADTYLNRAAFTDPPVAPGGRNIALRLGTLGPILPNVRGPMSHSHDISVKKGVAFREHLVWELQGTFVNIMNLALPNDPVTSLGNPFFGQITGKGGSRNIELSTRIVF